MTPTNAESILRDVVRLIVAEGVTEIPEEFCCYRGGSKGFKSLETIVFSKSVSVIREHAFYDCTNLKSLMIAKDSQLIERAAFPDCKSLQSIAIPDSVTTIEEFAFCDCTNLESQVSHYNRSFCISSVLQSQVSDICGTFIHPNNQQSYILHV